MKLGLGKKRKEQPQRRRVSAERIAEKRETGRTGNAIFRRNRTLVGSLSPQVGSASELTGDLRSPRAHVHHLTAHRRMLGTIFILVVGAIGLLFWLIYEFTAVVQVSPTSGIAIDQSRYQHAINEYFMTHPLERLRVLLNENGLTSYLGQVTPEVEDARSGGSAGFATSQFDLVFRRPVVGWLIGAHQYYVDGNGVSFQKNYFDQPAVKIIDQSTVAQAAGTTVASSRFLRFVGQAIVLSKANGLTITQAIIPADTTHQIEIIVMGHSYPIKFSLDRPVGEQVEDMQHALAYFDAKGQHPAYVDVRVSGKAYYK
ncbi:MAG: hypothetical protein JWO07_446 [Candidatus Saccharibacteria bacterium]|nr:hypothetical protein [Candidatus Saccharibacteria bacterium]